MLKFIYIFTFIFVFLVTNIKADLSCDPIIEESTGNITISIIDCTYDSGLNLGPENEETGNFIYNIENVTGYIPEILPQYNIGRDHIVNVFNQSDFSIGKMHIEANGVLNITEESTVTFTGEGLQTGEVNLNASSLVLKGENSMSTIDFLSADPNSTILLDNKATLIIGGGEGIKRDLDVSNNSTVVFDYDIVEEDLKGKEEDDNEEEDEEGVETYQVNILTLDNSNLEKRGSGKVVIDSFDIIGNISIKVDGGILDVSSLGNLSDLPTGSLQVNNGGILEFSQGDFSIEVDHGGELHYISDFGNADLQVNPKQSRNNNSTPELKGTVIIDGNRVTLRNSYIDILKVESGQVTFGSDINDKTHIKRLQITGERAIVRNGVQQEVPLEINILEISDGGRFYYGAGGLDNLESLRIFDNGIFIYQGIKDLELSNINAENNGEIVVAQTARGTLILKDSVIGNLVLQSSQGEDALDISQNNRIKKLTIDSRYADREFDIEGSDIEQVEMIRRGTVNIFKGASVKEFINSSVYAPTINIWGGNLGGLSLNSSGKVTIEEEVKIDILTIAGKEEVDINGSDIKELDITTLSTQGILNIAGATIGTLRLENDIEFSIEDTLIHNYEIGVEEGAFDIIDQNITNNFTLRGRETHVNFGDGNKIPTVKSITLDYGTLNYNYNQDYYLDSLTTTVDHSEEEPEEDEEVCEEGDEECEETDEEIGEETEEEEEEKPIYNSEFVMETSDSTLTVGELNLENLRVIKGQIIVDDYMQIQRKLTIGLDNSNKINELGADYRVISRGEMLLEGLVALEFRDTHDLLLNKHNYFLAAHSETNIQKDANRLFEHDLAFWFDVSEYLCEDCFDKPGSSYVAEVVRKYTYEEVVSTLEIFDRSLGVIPEVASVLDNIISGDLRDYPDYMKPIIQGLDTKSNSQEELVNNLRELLPVSNRAYSNFIHINNYRAIDSLSMKLRDFTNLSHNIWSNISYNTGILSTYEDIVGYTESTNSFDIGYSYLLTSKMYWGVTATYTTGNLNGRRDNYKQDTNIFTGSFGIDYLINDNYYTKSILSYSIAGFDNRRNINIADDHAYSEVKANEVIGHLELGYSDFSNTIFGNFNTSYGIFYSIGKINIDGYNERGIGTLNVQEGNTLVHDIGVSSFFDKEIFYNQENVSLKPYFSFLVGLRYYNNAQTDFSFQDLNVEQNDLQVSGGNYSPFLAKYKVGIDYIKESISLSLDHGLTTDMYRYIDASLRVSVKFLF